MKLSAPKIARVNNSVRKIYSMRKKEKRQPLLSRPNSLKNISFIREGFYSKRVKNSMKWMLRFMVNLPKVQQNRRSTDGQKKRKTPWLLGIFVLLLLASLLLLQSSNLWKNLTVDSASDTLLLYALSSLNFIAFVVFAFIFARSLLKLRQERRELQIGSKIKTKLLIYFFMVSILPLIAMAVFSYLYLNRALENWFSEKPKTVFRQAQRLQDQALEDQRRALSASANGLAKALERQSFDSAYLTEIAAAGNLLHIEIIGPDGNSLLSGKTELASGEPNKLKEFLRPIYQGKFNSPEFSDGRDFDLATSKMSNNRMLIIVPGFVAGQPDSGEMKRPLEEYDELKANAILFRQVGMTTVGLLTFLLIFAASWFALYVAKGLTGPIRALAEGANEIARGNLGHQVNVIAEDELDLLVNAFNEMSGKLEENSAEIKERRRYIETILQSLSTGVISFDNENRVTTINRAAIGMLELEDQDFAGVELKKLVNQENTLVLERLISRAKRIGQASEQTAFVREHADGSRETDEGLPVALAASGLPNEGGAVLVIEDLSELIAAQRASAWREVARRMAHEIKNPLTPIQLSAERIAKRFAETNGGKQLDLVASKEKVELKPKDTASSVIKDGTDTILREVSSLKSMVDEFSRFARLPNAKLEMGDVNEVISQAVSLYEGRESDAKISVKLGVAIPDVLIDEEQLKRVCVNLIDNAIEAFDSDQKGKEIEIKSYSDPARDLIGIEVSDNGNGIHPSDFRRLFQPYFSTKGRGTGLGLAIVHRIISEHGGKIRAGNNSSSGAKFVIELPNSN